MTKAIFQFLGCLAFLVAVVGFSMPPQGKPKPSRNNVSCVAEKQDEVIVNGKTGETIERENWFVHCTIKQEDRLLYSGGLSLPYPASFRDAMDAIEEFRTKKANKIIKDYQEAKK